MLQLHDTASARVEPFVTREPSSAGLYICGSTVYGPPHIGHGRFSLVYDVLRRFLEYGGTRVEHVSNVTDIDDKIINKANEESRSVSEVAQQYESEWWEAMGRLGCLKPTRVPHATEFIDEMVELIAKLEEAGSAYETGDGVYFVVSAVPDYGLLAHQSLDSLRAGARVEINEEKRSPLDFALWKKAKPLEPSWPSPWGPGRPGWHTECVVMSLSLLGDGFDLHGGGQDLIFPHHENERAQAVARGNRFSRRWMHNGMVEAAGGEKMSKSLGNVLDLSELFELVDARAYRLLVLRSHYRAPMQVTSATLKDADSALGRIDALAERCREAFRLEKAAADAQVTAAFVERMEDDLDTPGATAVAFDALRRANVAFDARQLPAAVSLARATLGCFRAVGLEPKAGDEIDEAVLELGRRRDEARRSGDYGAADSLRSEIQRLGYVVEDTAGGTRIRR